MASISVHQLKKDFGTFKAIKGINLEVEKNEFLSILGPSGCGKSTLLRIIAGLESPSSGRIIIEGVDVTDVPVWKRKIGFVFQNFALWPHLSVFRNVSMGLELRRVPKAEIAKRTMTALRLVELDSMAERYPSQLSGGQQQRVALARAIVLEPAVLLLDEPLSALDKNLRQSMQVELKTLQQKLGLTTIFVTHDQEEALSLSDRIVVMNKGTIEQLDVPQAIYNEPTSTYVAGFVGEAHFFDGTIVYHLGEQGLETDDGTIVPVQGEAKVGEIRRAFVRPEWMQLAHCDEFPDSNLPRVTVERLIFFGKTTEYLVNLGNERLRVAQSKTRPAHLQGDNALLKCRARLLPLELGNAS